MVPRSRSRGSLSSSLAVIGLTLVVGAAAALERGKPSGVFFEPLEVPLVSLDVSVLDRHDRPVTGLTPDDFEVFEDGEPVEISHFYAAEAVRGRQTSTVDEQQLDRAMLDEPSQSLFLVAFIDETNFSLSRRIVALENLRSFFTQKLPEDLQVMLLSFDGSLKVRQPLTDDPAQLLAAIGAIKSSVSTSYDVARASIIREIEANADPQLAEGGQGEARAQRQQGGLEDPQMRVSIALSALHDIDSYARERRHRTLRSLDAVRSLVRSMAGLAGRKVVFYLSDGIEMRPGENLYYLWERAFATLAREHGVFSALSSRRESVHDEVGDVVEYANSYRVSFYTLSSLADAVMAPVSAANRGIEGTSGLELLQLSTEEAFSVLTSGTGGRSLANNSKLAAHLDEVVEELSSYYSLGYRPEHGQEGSYHRVKVKVKLPGLMRGGVMRGGVKIRHREGYQIKSINDRMADRTLSAAIHRVTNNPLGITVETTEKRRRDDGAFMVPILIKVPIDKIVLMPQETTHKGRISVFVVVRDLEGGLSGVQQRQYPVEIQNDQLLVAISQKAGFAMGLLLREGPQVVAVGVRDELSNVEATVTLDINVEETDR